MRWLAKLQHENTRLISQVCCDKPTEYCSVLALLDECYTRLEWELRTALIQRNDEVAEIVARKRAAHNSAVAHWLAKMQDAPRFDEAHRSAAYLRLACAVFAASMRLQRRKMIDVQHR